MTEINFAYRSYWLLPHISLIETTGKGFAVTPIGIYDPEYGIRAPPYVPGKFLDETGKTVYPDDMYRDHEALFFAIKHKPLGNFPYLRNIGDGHFHDKYIVSTNDISPNSVKCVDPDGNILIWGNLKQNPPHSETLWNNRQLTLIEITPQLSPEELQELALNEDYVSKVLQENKKSIADVYKHRNENRLLVTRVAGGLSTIALLQAKISSLLDNYELMMEEVINLRLEVKKDMNKGIKLAEGKYGINAPWDKVHDDEMKKTVEQIRLEMRKITAMAEADGVMNDPMKAMLFQQVRTVLGDDFIRNIIGTSVQTQPVTPVSPTQQVMNYAAQHDNKQLSDTELQLRIKEMLDKMEREQSTPNSATAPNQEQPPQIIIGGKPLQAQQYVR